MMAGDPVAEKAAASVLKRAVELDTAKRFTESLVCYQEGLQLLMEALKAKGIIPASTIVKKCNYTFHLLFIVVGQEDGRRAELRKRVVDYMDRVYIEDFLQHV